MTVLIKGMEMPKYPGNIMISIAFDGQVYSVREGRIMYEAVEVPTPHGRLGYDSDKKWLSEKVLVFIRYKHATGIEFDRWTAFDGGRWEVFNPIAGYVTHWMPLPEPPKEETWTN